MGLPRAAWVKLNRLRTSVGKFHSSMYKWGLVASPNCQCGASEQTADHVLISCSINRATHRACGLTVSITKLNAGLTTSPPTSDSGSARAWSTKRINPRLQSCLCLTWSGCPCKRQRRR